MSPRVWLLAMAALMSCVVLQINLPNLGNNLIPRNFFAWAVLILGTAGLLIQAVRQPVFYWSNKCYFWLLPPAAVLLHGLLIPSALPHYGLLAAGALGMFSIWLVALVQARLKPQDWWQISAWMLVGSVVLVLLAMPSANYLNQPQWIESLPLVLRLPEGGFQQRNVFASFLGSVLLWAWAMRLRTGARWIGSDMVFALAAFLLAWCVFLSGSRTGTVAVAGSAALLSIYAWVKGWRHTGLWLPSLAVAGALALTVVSPIEDINARMSDLADGGSTTSRLSMWQVSYALGFEQRWLGHGLGSFTQVFHPKFVEMARQGVDLTYVNFLNHPHNETLLWWVETGIYGLVFVILPWVVSLLFLVLWRNPSAMLFVVSLGPMLLHTQTEFPLHTSGVHWFLAGLIIVSTTRGDLLPARQMDLKPIWPSVIGVFAALGVVGMLHSGWMSYRNWHSANQNQGQLGEFIEKRAQDPVFNHFVLGAEARDFWVLTLARIAVASKDVEWSATLREPLEQMQQRWQGPPVWRALAQIYQLQDDTQALRRQIEWVQALQPGAVAALEASLD